MSLRPALFTLFALFALAPLASGADPADVKPSPTPVEKIVKTEAQWRKELPPEVYRVLRQQGTERAFTGPLWDNHAAGTYLCAGCKLPLFRSETKFDSGTGWPSFHSPAAPGHVATKTDAGHGMIRTEVLCARCDGHLGHVFDDGPAPTGLRYCINSASLAFEPAKEK